jgi:nickel superoxide dismutase
MKFLESILKTLPSKTVYAHCDVPCGIYDPKPAQIAAATVLKMVQKIKEIKAEPGSPEELEARNTFVRCVWTKEEHARKCKEELLILWTDYFKAEHLEKFPDLHEIFWKAAKLCSENKQHVDEAKAQELVEAVDKIAQMFVDSKK